MARAFTAALLILFVAPIFFLALMIPLEAAIAFMDPRAGSSVFSGSATVVSQLTDRQSHSLLALPCCFLSYVCVRLLWSIPARICLGLISGFFVLCFAVMIAVLTHSGFQFISAGILLFILIGSLGFMGFFSMLWISLRAPQNSPPLLDRTSNYPSFN
jgi:hypothetical protein